MRYFVVGRRPSDQRQRAFGETQDVLLAVESANLIERKTGLGTHVVAESALDRNTLARFITDLQNGRTKLC